jgi:excisionase family DNA binding protein
MRIDENEVYTTKEVAEILKISMPTIKRMLKDGRLASTRIGRQHRFLGRDLLRMLRPGEDTGAPRPEERVAIQQPAAALQQPYPRQADYAPSPAPPQPRAQRSPEESRHSYMLGKKLRADIVDAAGAIVFPRGTTVTDAVIREAGKKQKLVELLSNLER